MLGKVFMQHKRPETAAAAAFDTWINREVDVLQRCTQRQVRHVMPLLATGLVPSLTWAAASVTKAAARLGSSCAALCCR